MKATFTSPKLFTPIRFPAAAAIYPTLRQLWDSALTYFASSAEPSIRFERTGYGRSQWTAYDPTTQQSVTIDSELEMRIWLENRYYGSLAN
jgi:hypothetical protein